ncbi:NTP transferase domain-containing protein [Candidatus Peregrinibacteria bacterium]|nr:NTP transferase domain-containing protein [Candidatus Peregrinibacteria bacterium]
MKVLLLASGRSKRMQPVRDKNFLDFLGKTLLERQIESLKSNGFEDIIVVGGAHNLEEIKSYGFETVEQENLDDGMKGAISSSAKMLTEDVLIVSSNDVFDESVYALMSNAIKECSEDGVVLAKKVKEYFPGGYLELDSEGFMKSIVEKPEKGTEPSDLVNLVMHYFKDAGKFVEYLEAAKSENDDLYEVAMQNMINDGYKFIALPYEGYWQAIKFPWHIHKVFGFLFEKAEKHVSEKAQISENAVINGDVIIEDGVKVFDGAVINGPAYIGKGAVIATNALVRESHVGKNCVVGYSTEVARSYLGDDVWTHSNYIGDSIIGNNVSFGAGTVTGNLRLDEKTISMSVKGEKMDTGENKLGIVTGDHVRAGVNTSFMPGVKIGSNSFVGAGLVICEDIPENSFVRGCTTLKISKNKVNVEKIKRNL